MKTVYIVGGHPSKQYMPVKDNVDYWSTGSNAWSDTVTPKIDVLFEMHKLKRIEKRIQNINDLDIPVYVQEITHKIKNETLYPIKKIVDNYGIKKVDNGIEKYKLYATNTISYMLALAIEYKYDRIELHGIKMAALSEYGIQLPSCEYMIGLARGKGVDVVIHNSNLCNTMYLYGYDS